MISEKNYNKSARLEENSAGIKTKPIQIFLLRL
jgi:hypothetical protein